MNILNTKRLLSVVLDMAEEFAEKTDNKLDDVIVKATCQTLRMLFGISKVGER